MNYNICVEIPSCLSINRLDHIRYLFIINKSQIFGWISVVMVSQNFGCLFQLLLLKFEIMGAYFKLNYQMRSLR